MPQQIFVFCSCYNLLSLCPFFFFFFFFFTEGKGEGEWKLRMPKRAVSCLSAHCYNCPQTGNTDPPKNTEDT